MLIKYSIFFFASFLFLILTACDRECTYSYYLKNKSTDNIRLTFLGDTWKEYNIPANSEQLILVEPGLNEPNDMEYRDTMIALSFFKPMKNDTIPSVTNFNRRDKWVYEVVSNSHTSYAAKYTAVITDDDF